MNIIDIMIISTIEGLCEPLPISSTAHIMIVSKIIGLDCEDSLYQLLHVSVQLGAIIAIIINLSNEFHILFKKDNLIFKKIFISLIPILIIGMLINKNKILFLYKKNIIILSLLIGGLLLISTNYIKTKHSYITKKNALIIGIFQCLAIIPGLSRSGITILAGIYQKIRKDICIYFSFGLATPTIICAFIYKTYNFISLNSININCIQFILIGNIISFFISYIIIQIIKQKIQHNKFNFIPLLGIYRIIISIILYYYV